MRDFAFSQWNWINFAQNWKIESSCQYYFPTWIFQRSKVYKTNWKVYCTILCLWTRFSLFLDQYFQYVTSHSRTLYNPKGIPLRALWISTAWAIFMHDFLSKSSQVYKNCNLNYFSINILAVWICPHFLVSLIYICHLEKFWN